MNNMRILLAEPKKHVRNTYAGKCLLNRMNTALEALRVVRNNAVDGATIWYEINGMIFHLAEVAESYGLGVQYKQKCIDNEWCDEDVKCFYLD